MEYFFSTINKQAAVREFEPDEDLYTDKKNNINIACSQVFGGSGGGCGVWIRIRCSLCPAVRSWASLSEYGFWPPLRLLAATTNSRVSETHTQPKSSCLPSHRRIATNTVRSLRFTIDMFGPVQVVVAVGDSSPANNWALTPLYSPHCSSTSCCMRIYDSSDLFYPVLGWL